MARKFWNINSYDKKAASMLALKCGVDDFAVLLLQSRGIKTADEIISFLSCTHQELSSPFLLKDMEKAALRIKEAIENGEKIHVFGDYDCDGVTGTALLTSYLEMTGADVTCGIPSRLHEGYGLSADAAHSIAEMGVNLVITVDNGIASYEEAEIFSSYGIDFIITDHHKVGDTLPAAFAVVDPHREDDTSPEENLAGVGVALKLAAALEDGNYDAVFSDFGDLAAIGTIADIVPLCGENRIIVAKGLSCIENTYRPGLRLLLETAGINSSVTSTGVAFGIAPRINAAGRIGSANTALRLLMTDDEEDARELVKQVISYNTQRQTVENEITGEIEKYFDENPERRNDFVLVAAAKNLHPGVIGITASRLVEKYGRPALVISIGDDGVSRGSGRSIDGLSLYDALKYSSEYLLQYGGHTLAAGFSVREEKIEDFRKKINEYAATLSDFYPSIDIDVRLNPAALSYDILESVSMLEPYGAGNPTPIFGLFAVEIQGVKSIGGDKHMKLTLSKGACSFSAVYFNETVENFPYVVGDTVDLAVKIEPNEYKGETKVSIQIKDIRPAGENDKALFDSLYKSRRFFAGQEITDTQRTLLCPDRNLLGEVFRFVREQKHGIITPEIICMRKGFAYEKAGAVEISLKALTEVGLLEEHSGVYKLSAFEGKADLSTSKILMKLEYRLA